LEPYEIPIIASVLKLYLLELPGRYISISCPGDTNICRLAGVFTCLRNYENDLLDASS
jgi:hypothetical protein